VYTEVDRIFQRQGANRSYYFWRQFQGKEIRKIMDKSDELFGSNGTGGELRMMFISHMITKGLVDAEKEKLLAKMNKMCDNIGLGLKLWDGALAGIHATVPDNDHCNRAQDRIDKAMAHTRRMGISVMPKMHGMEMHVVNQMGNTPGGIGRMMEHWIEQYHQIGYWLNVAYCQVGSLKFAAGIWSTMERRTSNHQVKMCQQQIEAKYVGSRKRKATQLKEEMHVKQEKRDQALVDICSSLGTNES
jgi:hypothetical protein